MSDIEKAIEDLRGLNERSSESSPIFKERHGKNFEMAISALEKDISKKVIKVTIPKKYSGCAYRCPTCDKLVKFVRCLDCGQKLDWSEVEE